MLEKYRLFGPQKVSLSQLFKPLIISVNNHINLFFDDLLFNYSFIGEFYSLERCLMKKLKKSSVYRGYIEK